MSFCENCKSERKTKLTRGYCKKCYRLILLKEKIEKWSFDFIDEIPDTLYPQSDESGKGFKTRKYFGIIKRGCLSQVTDRLAEIRYREEGYQNGCDGITIEHMLCRLGNRVSPRYYKDKHYGSANRIDWNFPPDQKRELFRLLAEIEETIPKASCSWTKAIQDWERESERKT